MVISIGIGMVCPRGFAASSYYGSSTLRVNSAQHRLDRHQGRKVPVSGRDVRSGVGQERTQRIAEASSLPTKGSSHSSLSTKGSGLDKFFSNQPRPASEESPEEVQEDSELSTPGSSNHPGDGDADAQEELPEGSSVALGEEVSEENESEGLDSPATDEGSVPPGQKPSARVGTRQGPDGTTSVAQQEAPTKRFSVDYFGIVFGPSVSHPIALQPNSFGVADENRPVIVKNFLAASVQLTEKISAAATAYWVWQPVMGQQVYMQDPFFRISYDPIFELGQLRLYGDVRFSIPVTQYSRESQLLWGLQTFQSLSYYFPSVGLTAALYASERKNFYGDDGWGNDFEFYIGPSLILDLSNKVALSFLYELQMSHVFGTPSTRLYTDSFGFEPGVVWSITPSITVNPYLHLSTINQVSWDTTTFGMWLSWNLI